MRERWHYSEERNAGKRGAHKKSKLGKEKTHPLSTNIVVIAAAVGEAHVDDEGGRGEFAAVDVRDAGGEFVFLREGQGDTVFDDVEGHFLEWVVGWFSWMEM